MKTLKEKIEVMQAALDGKIIEYIDILTKESSWSRSSTALMLWNWSYYDYRIKVEKTKEKRFITLDELPEYFYVVSSDKCVRRLPAFFKGNGFSVFDEAFHDVAIWHNLGYFWSPSRKGDIYSFEKYINPDEFIKVNV